MRVLTKKRLGNRLHSYATLLIQFATFTPCIQIDLAPSPCSRRPWRTSRRLSRQFFLAVYSSLYVLIVPSSYLDLESSSQWLAHPFRIVRLFLRDTTTSSWHQQRNPSDYSRLAHLFL